MSQYERSTKDPSGRSARTYRFLGLDDRFVLSDVSRPVGPTPSGTADLAEASPVAARTRPGRPIR